MQSWGSWSAILLYLLAWLISGLIGGPMPASPPIGGEPVTEWPQPDIGATGSLAGVTIALDAGHGGPDLGAKGPAGTLEKDNTLAAVLATKAVLEEAGAKVVLTRDGDYQPGYPTVTANLWDKSKLLGYRATLAKQAAADFFISIHNDWNEKPSVHGTTTYYWGARGLAEAVQNAVCARLGSRNVGVIKNGFYILTKTPMPAILIEVGFISNPNEEQLLMSDHYHQSLALGIRDGLLKYLSK